MQSFYLINDFVVYIFMKTNKSVIDLYIYHINSVWLYIYSSAFKIWLWTKEGFQGWEGGGGISPFDTILYEK